MPFAPPAIHLIFPNICGSGKKGAKPNVRQSRIIKRQSFSDIMCLYLLFFNGHMVHPFNHSLQNKNLVMDVSCYKIVFTNLSIEFIPSFITCLTKALPIIAPLAYFVACEKVSLLEIPKPTICGLFRFIFAMRSK